MDLATPNNMALQSHYLLAPQKHKKNGDWTGSNSQLRFCWNSHLRKGKETSVEFQVTCFGQRSHPVGVGSLAKRLLALGVTPNRSLPSFSKFSHFNMMTWQFTNQEPGFSLKRATTTKQVSLANESRTIYSNRVDFHTQIFSKSRWWTGPCSSGTLVR